MNNEPVPAVVQPAEAAAEAQPAKEYKWEWKVSAIHKLRVNIKSLTAEAKLIRQEVKRCSPLYMQELTDHRRGRLRQEARLTHLALAYLRGRPYNVVENRSIKPDPKSISSKLVRMIGRNTADIALDSSIERWLYAGD